jgi:hypothetical protein
MSAVHASHIPSCDPIPARERRPLRACLPLLAAVLLLPAPAMAQEVRARDLSIIEDLLAETVQEAIQVTVREVNNENLRAQEADHEAGDAVQIRYVFRSSARTQARGMFLEDYGVVFTVQVPNLTYAYSAVFALPSGGSGFRLVQPGSLETAFAGALGQEMQLRNQMSRMRAENEILIQRLREVETSGASSEKAERLRTAIAEMESAYNEYAAEAEKSASEGERARVVAEERRGDERDRPTNRISGLRILTSASPEDLARAEALATDQKNQIEGAVITAVVDTLAQYGRIIHGLDDNDRLAVVLLPSSYLNQMVSWMRATKRDEEFIISVRFRDVMELDKDDITAEEFGSRIRVESRLGQPHQNR